MLQLQKLKFFFSSAALFLLAGCNPSHGPERFDGKAMSIPFVVQLGHKLNSTEKMEIEALIFSSFSEINRIYNPFNPQSEISAFNKLEADEKMQLSYPLFQFLNRVSSIVQLTEGRYDPTLKKSGEKSSMGWGHIHNNEDVFWKDHSETSIDLCGSVKGFFVDQLVEKLQNLGYKNIYVDWGGEIKTFGLHPCNRKWKIGLMGSQDKICLYNSAIATSGNYLQKWSENGLTYTHIIDPITLNPLEITDSSITSVSVLNSSCMLADALATALMVFPTHEEAKKWAKKHGIKIWIH